MDCKSEAPKIILNNNIEMPMIGLGTCRLENIEISIETAIKNGYRSFDTAYLYDNEVELGKALKRCIENGLIKREELFITTKLAGDFHEDPVAGLKISLERLNMNYVDLFLIHGPTGKVVDGKLVKQTPMYKVWAAMEECVDLGMTKSIGVSNFNSQLLLDVISYANIKPVCNQVEIHPLLTQNDLIDFCKKFNIAIVAYNPIIRGRYAIKDQDYDKFDLMNNEIIMNLSKKYNRTSTQIVLNWHLNRNIVVIPKSSSHERQLENYNCFDFKMEEDDYSKISSLNCNKRFNITKNKIYCANIEIFA